MVSYPNLSLLSLVVGGMWGGGGEFLKLAGCPGRSWGEPGVGSSGARAWGWVKGLAVSLFLLT